MSYSDQQAYQWAMEEIAKLEAKVKDLEERNEEQKRRLAMYAERTEAQEIRELRGTIKSLRQQLTNKPA